jgi:glycosyltransferase involved in cell wall biosynthesis
MPRTFIRQFYYNLAFSQICPIRLFADYHLRSSFVKILFGMPSKDSWGGPIASEPPFVEALRKMGIDCVEEVYVYGNKVKPTLFLERIRRVLKTAFRLRKILKNQQFDLIHLNTSFDLRTILRDSVSIFLMNPKKTKIFFKVHGSEAENFVNTNLFVRFLINYLSKKVDGLGIHTKEETSNFMRLGFAQEKFHFVKNAVTIHENLGEDFSRSSKEKTDCFELLFISRFISTKGLLETIQACAIVRYKGFKFILHCLGDGEIRDKAEQEVSRLGLQTQVKFTGYIPENEVTKYFLKTDLFIFPTRHIEGFSNVLFKAVAVGMPIVTTKIRAAAEYLKNRENCLFCTSKPENIAEKIIQLIENTALRSEMSKNNLNIGKSLLPEKIAEEFLQIYRKMIDG